MADALVPLLRPTYYVDIELRTYITVALPDSLVGLPDVLVMSVETSEPPPVIRATALATPLTVALPMPEEVRERYLEIREVTTNQVVTVIELLSLANKLTGEGRRQYEEKRLKILGSRTNLIEIDLLRAGPPLPFANGRQAREADYRIIVSRAWQRPRADAYLFGVRDPIPTIPVPLVQGGDEPALPLNSLLHDLYERAAYELVIDYTQATDPPLQPEDVAWASSLISSK
jgi:hypothetical protein